MEYIIGIVVSLIVQATKKYTKNITQKYILLLVVSIAGATVYYYASNTAHWSTIVEIAGSAAAFHNLLIRRFEEK